jgi:hypothetical protein
MNVVTLNKSGELMENQKAVTEDPLTFLSFRVALEEGFTLRSFFQMIEKYPVLAKLNAFFPTYLEQFRKCPKSNCVYNGFDFLEFSKTVEMIGYPGEPRLEIYHSLQCGYGSETSELKSSRLESLLDMPLRLGKLKHVIFGDKMDVFEFETVFSLFEFIDGVAWELGFHGTPEVCELRR